MHSVAPLLVAVLVQALGEAGPTLGFEAPWALPLLALLPYLAALGARRAGRRGRFRRAARWSRVARWSAALGFTVAVVVCGWVGTVERWTGVRLGDLVWPEPAVLVSLAPFLVLQVLALHAESLLYSSAPLEQRRAFQLHLRGFAFVLLPVLVYLATTWLVGLHPVARAWLQWVGLAQGLFVVALVAVVAFLLPYFMRHVFDTHPVPEGPARRLLELVAARARFKPAEWLVWRTGGTMANAAVVGFTPWGRLVLFTDELLAVLGPRELVAVVGHEIGHARRGHAWILLTYAVAVVLGVDLALTAAFERLGESPSDLALYAVIGGALVCLGLGALLFAWLSRRLELDADLYCAKLTGDGPALASALRQVDGNWERGGWRHFSSKRRVAFLAEATALPGRGRRLERLVASARWIGFALALAAICVQLVSLSARLPHERIEADLALGRYRAAARRATELPPAQLDGAAGDELRLLLEVGAEAPDGAAPAALCEMLEDELERLDTALAGLDHDTALAGLDRAYAFAALAVRRGDPRCAAVESALHAARRGDQAQLERHLGAVDDEFRARHAAALASAATLVAQ